MIGDVRRRTDKGMFRQLTALSGPSSGSRSRACRLRNSAAVQLFTATARSRHMTAPKRSSNSLLFGPRSHPPTEDHVAGGICLFRADCRRTKDEERRSFGVLTHLSYPRAPAGIRVSQNARTARTPVRLRG